MLFVASFLLAAALPAAPSCRSLPVRIARGDSVINRAISAMGLDRLQGQVRMTDGFDLSSDLFQADRMYAPIPYRQTPTHILIDWENGAQKTGTLLSTSTGAAMIPANGHAVQPPPSMQTAIGTQRALDPWLVLADWKRSANVQATEQCMFRDFWRTVLTRTDGRSGAERLYVDDETGFPAKLERRESHALWGDVLAEYVWTSWMKSGPVAVPVYTFQLLDGALESERRTTQHALITRDSAGVMTLPADIGPAPAPPPALQQTGAPDTVRVTANTFLLVTRAYTNVVTLQRDTVFVLDAQTNEARARADSTWIAALFPGKHAVVLVVTDLAWPHIEGVRFWAANGASIITQRASVEFLQRVIDHKWTLTPDLLEQKRATVHPRIRAVDDALDIAGGAIKLRSIATEGALLAFLPGEKFLYAGDYVQQGSLLPARPGLFNFTYADEVAGVAKRNGFAPEKFAAMHVALTPWQTLVEKLAAQ